MSSNLVVDNDFVPSSVNDNHGVTFITFPRLPAERRMPWALTQKQDQDTASVQTAWNVRKLEPVRFPCSYCALPMTAT